MSETEADRGKQERSKPVPDVPLAAIEEAIKSIRYGVVQIIVQDGRVIQIDKTEKIRLA